MSETNLESECEGSKGESTLECKGLDIGEGGLIGDGLDIGDEDGLIGNGFCFWFGFGTVANGYRRRFPKPL